MFTADDLLHNRSAITLLEKLGLSRNETKCYVALLTMGSGGITKIANYARVNRVNAHHALERLVRRGLAMQEMGEKSRTLTPAPLSHLLELARTHQKRASTVRWKIEELIPAFEKLGAGYHEAHRSGDARDVLFFYGEDAFFRVAERTLLIPQGSTVCYLEIKNYFDTSAGTYRNYDRDYYIPARLGRDIKARVLHKQDAEGRSLKKRDHKEIRETRFLSTDQNFPADIYIYGDEVALLWTTDEINAVVIRGGPILALIHMLFEMVWERARTTVPIGTRGT